MEATKNAKNWSLEELQQIADGERPIPRHVVEDCARELGWNPGEPLDAQAEAEGYESLAAWIGGRAWNGTHQRWAEEVAAKLRHRAASL